MRSVKVVVGQVRPGIHAASGVGHDDLRRAIGRGAKHPDGVVVGQHHVRDRLVGHGADFLDHHVGQAGRRLCVDDHDAVIADDNAGVGIALGCEGPKAVAHFGEADGLLAQVALGCECFGHRASTT